MRTVQKGRGKRSYTFRGGSQHRLTGSDAKEFEIGRILHLKSEISKSQIGPVQFAISDFGFEMQDSSDFKILVLGFFQADQILVRFTPADNLIGLPRHQDLRDAGPRIVIG